MFSFLFMLAGGTDAVDDGLAFVDGEVVVLGDALYQRIGELLLHVDGLAAFFAAQVQALGAGVAAAVAVDDLSAAAAHNAVELTLRLHIGEVAVDGAFADGIGQRIGDLSRGEVLIDVLHEIVGEDLSLFCDVFGHDSTSESVEIATAPFESRNDNFI